MSGLLPATARRERARVRRRAVLLGLGALLVAWGAACGAFSLNDVVPFDAAAADASNGRDGSGTTGDSGDARDSAPPPDVGADCGEAHDPCGCLPPPTLVTAGRGTVSGMAVLDGSVYWLSPNLTGGGGVQPWVLPGASVDAAATSPFEPAFSWVAEDPLPIAIGSFYFAIGEVPFSIETLPLETGADGGVVRLVSALPVKAVSLRVGPGGLYWTNVSAEVCHAALDGTLGAPADSGCGAKPIVLAVTGTGYDLALNDVSIYLSVAADIRMASIVGGASKVIYKGRYGARLLFASDDDLIWREPNGDSGIIMRSLPDGADAAALATSGPIATLVVDTAAVYFSTTNRILKVDRTGGATSVVACATFPPQAMAVDENFLYWGSEETSGVWRIAK